MTVLQPLWLREEDVPELPEGWQALTTVEAADQLKPGKLFDQKTSSPDGDVPVVNQSLDGFVGYHSEEPGVFASIDKPVVTFANHTCAMRLMKQPFSCIQNIFPKVGREGICDTRFFFYAAMGRVDLSDYKGHHPLFRQAYIPVPPLPTQQRIAAILSAYDDLIENNTRRIAILEEMARRLYEEWFVHFRFPGYEKAEFDETELGRTPQGWQVETVAQTFEITGGGTPSKKVAEYWADGTIEWFSPTDLTRAGTTFMDGSSSKITALGLRKSSARLFPPFSVMMTSRATIGAIAINTTEACTNQGFITCIPNDRFPLYLLLHWLRDNVEVFISLASGATFKEISKGVFKEIKLLVPPQDIADRFEQTVGPMMHEALVLQRKNANLRAQRDLLLPKLVSGEIDVSEVETAMEAAE